MMKKKKLTEEEKEAKRKERYNTSITTTLVTGITTASTQFDFGLNKADKQRIHEKYAISAMMSALSDEQLASLSEEYGIMSKTEKCSQDTKRRIL